MPVRVRPTAALRELVERPGLLLITECYSALTARIAEDAGFPALYCGGYGLAGMHLALPDHGIISSAEIAGLVAPILGSVSVPVIVDADQGGETSLSVRRAVKQLEREGVAGFHIEDTLNPKHLPSLAQGSSVVGDRLQSIDQMRHRIAAAADARADSDLLLIARTDVLANGGSVEDAVHRGRLYAEAGADVFFCLGMQPADIDRIAAEVPIPLMDINHSRKIVAKSRLKMSVFAGFTVSLAAGVYRKLVRDLLETGDYGDWVRNQLLTATDYSRLVNDDTYLALATKWLELADDGRGPSNSVASGVDSGGKPR